MRGRRHTNFNQVDLLSIPYTVTGPSARFIDNMAAKAAVLEENEANEDPHRSP